MNETELRYRLSDLDIELILNNACDRLELSDTDLAKLDSELRLTLDKLEGQIVRQQLYQAAMEYVHKQLCKNNGPGLNAQAIAVMGDAGRFEELGDLWAMAPLDDFKNSLRRCIEAALSSSNIHPVPPTPSTAPIAGYTEDVIQDPSSLDQPESQQNSTTAKPPADESDGKAHTTSYPDQLTLSDT